MLIKVERNGEFSNLINAQTFLKHLTFAFITENKTNFFLNYFHFLNKKPNFLQKKS